MTKHSVCEFRPIFYPLPGMRCIGICDDAIDVFFLRLIRTTQLYQSTPPVPIGGFHFPVDLCRNGEPINCLLPFAPVEIDNAGKLSRRVAALVNLFGSS